MALNRTKHYFMRRRRSTVKLFQRRHLGNKVESRRAMEGKTGIMFSKRCSIRS
jgi:hypothetical protein